MDLDIKAYRQSGVLDHSSTAAQRDRLIQELQEKHVLRNVSREEEQSDARSNPDAPIRALNFVSGWDTAGASLVILTPIAISLVVTVVWPIVAVLKYEEDVQTSVQTGTAVASYLITAGKCGL